MESTLVHVEPSVAAAGLRMRRELPAFSLETCKTLAPVNDSYSGNASIPATLAFSTLPSLCGYLSALRGPDTAEIESIPTQAISVSKVLAKLSDMSLTSISLVRAQAKRN